MMAKIFIDAGHGGKDSGAVNGNIYEKDIALSIALKLEKMLKTCGIETVMSRTTDVFVTLQDRAKLANNSNVDLFISIHVNSSTNLAKGIETLVYSYRGKNKDIAQNVQDNLIATTGTLDRGIKERPDLYVLSATKMTAILIETGFIKTEYQNLLSDDYQDKIASAITNAICKSFNLEVKNMDKIENVEQALAVLVNAKIINSPDYWLKACDVVKYLPDLLINFANKIQ
jgi:N-acetylmuramoyl-L-alanine amidase